MTLAELAVLTAALQELAHLAGDEVVDKDDPIAARSYRAANLRSLAHRANAMDCSAIGRRVTAAAMALCEGLDVFGAVRALGTWQSPSKPTYGKCTRCGARFSGSEISFYESGWRPCNLPTAGSWSPTDAALCPVCVDSFASWQSTPGEGRA